MFSHLLILFSTVVSGIIAHSKDVDEARELCEDYCRYSVPGFRLVHCHNGMCLLKQIQYNYMELPLPEDSYFHPREPNINPHPCCRDLESQSVNEEYIKKCSEYQELTRNRTENTNPVRIFLDLALLHLTDVKPLQDRFQILTWIEMHFVDNRLRICNCKEPDNVPENKFMLIGAHRAERWWHPDIVTFNGKGKLPVDSLTNKRLKMKAMKKSGQTIVIIAFTVEIELDCSFEMDKALISPKNRCLFQLGSQAYDSEKIAFEVRSLRLNTRISLYRWHIHVFELYERDKFIQITKPRPETRAVDGFEIILAVDGPIMKDIRVIGVFQAFVYLVAFVVALLSGQPRSQERCGILGSIVTSCCITIMKMPNSLWGSAENNHFLTDKIRQSSELILFGIVSLFLILRFRADGTLTTGEQRRCEYAVGLIMCVFNFYHSRITENAIYENRYTTTCDNFLED